MAKAPTAAKPQRQHKATFSADKRNPGQYNIRVIGPHASAFAGKTIPVTRKDDSETEETLIKCFWAGTDQETGKPVALYTFDAKPRDDGPEDEIPF